MYKGQYCPKIWFLKSYGHKSLQCIDHLYTNNEYQNEKNYVYVPKCNVNICNEDVHTQTHVVDVTHNPKVNNLSNVTNSCNNLNGTPHPENITKCSVFETADGTMVNACNENVPAQVVDIQNASVNSSSNLFDLSNIPNITPNPENVQIQKTNINIISWNIQGVHEKLSENDLVNFLFKTNDIIILTETHAKNNTEFDFPNFHYTNYARKYVHPNAPGPSGGIGIFIRDNIYEGINIYSSDECIVWIKLLKSYFGGLNDKLIACCYFTPDGSSYIHNTISNTNYFSILENELAKHGNYTDIYICGDLNARTGNKQETMCDIPGKDGEIEKMISHSLINTTNIDICQRISKDNSENEYGKQLITLLDNTGLKIMNGRIHQDKGIGKFTCQKYNGCSVVDYLITSPALINSILDFEILCKRPKSDHMPIMFKLELPHIPMVHPEIEIGKILTKYKWSEEKLPEYLCKLSSQMSVELYEYLISESINIDMNSDTVCKLFYDYIIQAIDGTFKRYSSSIPKKQFPRNKWFDEECKQQKSVAHNYSNKYDITIEPHCSYYTKLIKQYNRIKQMKKRNYNKKLRENLEHLQSNNPQIYWKLWKSIIKKSNTTHSTLTLNDHELYYANQISPPPTPYFDTEAMETFKDFVLTYMNYDEQEQFYRSEDTDFSKALTQDICNSPISIEEIIASTKRQKNNKACGIDGISSEFFKYALDQLGDPMTLLFNLVFDNGDFPEIWAEGLICPIHKKNKKNIADNYRKITVMPVLGKIFESVLNSRLSFRNIVLEKEDNMQFGFKTNHRTTNNLFI